MAETIVSAELDEEVVPSSYTSETESAPAGAGQSITAPGAGLGRRKEAVARVRLVPGSGKWTINGRTLEDYFPNKLHQQLVKSPSSASTNWYRCSSEGITIFCSLVSFDPTR